MVSVGLEVTVGAGTRVGLRLGVRASHLDDAIVVALRLPWWRYGLPQSTTGGM